MNIKKVRDCWISYFLLFAVIICLSGCIDTEQVSSSECDKKPSQSRVASFENFEDEPLDSDEVPF